LGNYGYEEKYFYELQKIIGDTKSVDEINKCWNEVLEKTRITYHQDTPKNFRLRREFATRKLRNYMPMAVSFLSTGSYELDCKPLGWMAERS
jgi:hypothetical protein